MILTKIGLAIMVAGVCFGLINEIRHHQKRTPTKLYKGIEFICVGIIIIGFITALKGSCA